MVRSSVQRRLLFCTTGTRCALLSSLLAAAACSSTLRGTAPSVTPATPAVGEASPTTPEPVVPAPAEDPVVALIAASDGHFKTGEDHLRLGHVEAARLEFDLSVNVLLESPFGGRTEPAVREHFDRLIDRISAYELKALAEGDGFTEKRSEPASIDELLALSDTFAQPVESAPELKRTLESDLQTVGYDVPIPLNQKVLSYIALFQGRLRDFIQEGLTRGAKYLPMIQNVFRAEGLPLDLAYIPLVESAFKPNALSRAKARGVWQFVRGTGLENGLRQDWYIDERSDPEKATVAAAKYLSTLSAMFDSDWHLALASYNGGPGRVQRAMKRGQADDFWKLSAKRGILPRETREYVPMILAAIVVAKNPQQYGFELDTDDDTLQYDTVTLPGPVDLRRIAEWADTTIDVIQALNPELRRWTTPVRDTDYSLKVPAGTAVLVGARLAEAAPTELATLNYYTVKRGETMLTIAKKLRVNRADLAEANYMKATARLATGQQLLVPHETTGLMASRADRLLPAAEARPAAPGAARSPAGPRDTVPMVPAASASAAEGESELVKTFYRIKRGDTLASIARTFKTSVASLKRWNAMSGTQILAGERLTIYAARSN